MRPLTIALALAAVLAAGACSRGDGPDPAAGGTDGEREGRIDFSRTTAFDGNVLTVDLSSPGGGTLRVNTLRDAVETGVYRPPLPGHSGKSWVLRNFSHDSTSLVYAVASWANDDPADYLAAGWWIHQPGRDYDPDETEYVIFIDGPEIDAAADPPEMPVSGRARYSGEGGGIFRYVYGSGWGVLEGSVVLDEYRARMDVVADFDGGTLSGCLGCVGGIEADREHLAYLLGGDAADTPSPVADYEIRFSPVAYGSGGTFESGFDAAAGGVRHPDRRVTASRAFWGGSFSNVADADGDPRLIGGFADAEFAEADGSGGFFWGLFNVLSEATVAIADAPDFPDGSAPGGAATAPTFGPRLDASDLSPVVGAEDEFDPDVAGALARAARTAPNGASQSSLAEGGATSDETTARIVRDDEGNLVYEVTDGARILTHVPLSAPLTHQGLELALFTDLLPGIEPDLTSYPHEVLGVWAWDGHAGAFWDRSPSREPVDFAATSPTGTASYEGDAAGLHAAAGAVTKFLADVAMVADFGERTVSGQVDAFRSLTGESLGDLAVTLGETAFPAGGGSFSGDTSANVPGSGKWGGRWSDDEGRSLGGTFGFASADGGMALLGAFQAHSAGDAGGSPDDPVASGR